MLLEQYEAHRDADSWTVNDWMPMLWNTAPCRTLCKNTGWQLCQTNSIHVIPSKLSVPAATVLKANEVAKISLFLFYEISSASSTGISEFGALFYSDTTTRVVVFCVRFNYSAMKCIKAIFKTAEKSSYKNTCTFIPFRTQQWGSSNITRI